MRKLRLAIVLALLPAPALALPADAGPLPRPALAPPAAWVDVAPIPRPPKDSEGAATIDLLGDLQVRFANDGDTSYVHQAWKIGTAMGLDNGTLQIDWDPALERLAIHRYRILREGKPIDLLGDGTRLKVIQRETRMEDAMLDGRLTATMQPEDLRVGDTVELSYSITRSDPVMAGKSEYFAGPKDGATFGRFRVRLLWPDDKKMQWRSFTGILQPKLKHTAAGNELVADLIDNTAPLPPEGAPTRFMLVNAVEITEFPDWQTVSRQFAPIYADAARLSPDSPLKVEAARISGQSADPLRRAELALQLVQEQIRYLFLGMNDGGFVPARAEETWKRRFGDCKGKTVLLIALLNELGIEAHPFLVNTRNGDLVAERLPTMEAFDHVIVEAKIAGRSYWLDGTRLGDLKLVRIRTPAWHTGLPVMAQGADLTPLQPDPLDAPGETVSLTLDARAGLDVPAQVAGEMRFHGESASDMRMKYAGFSVSDRNRELRKLWRDTYDFVSPAKVSTREEPETGDFVITMVGAARMEWTSDQGTRWYEMDRARLGWRFDTAREGELNRDAPFAFDFPNWWASKQTIRLPNDGRGFRIQGGSLNKTVGGLYHFRRKVEMVGSVVTMEAQTRALSGELPAAQAEQTRMQMADLASNGVFIRAPEDYRQTDEEKELAARNAAAGAEQPKLMKSAR